MFLRGEESWLESPLSSSLNHRDTDPACCLTGTAWSSPREDGAD